MQQGQQPGQQRLQLGLLLKSGTGGMVVSTAKGKDKVVTLLQMAPGGITADESRVTYCIARRHSL